MIEFRAGDMFADIGPASVLVCPVNTVGVMGAGLALEFVRRWPAIKPAYRAACRAGYQRTRYGRKWCAFWGRWWRSAWRITRVARTERARYE